MAAAFPRPEQGLDSDAIVSDLKRRVESGELAPGDKLPTTRELCRLYGVSPNTLSRCIRRLKDNGYLNSRVGAGIYVVDPGGALSARGRPEQFRTATFVAQIGRGSDALTQEYLSHVYDNAILGIQDESLALNMVNGAVILPAEVQADGARLAQFISRHSAGADGVYFVGLVGHRAELLQNCARKPSIFIIARDVGPQPHNVFCIDMYRCARAVVLHLLERGYRRIGCLAGPVVGKRADDLGYGMRERAWDDVGREHECARDPTLLFAAPEARAGIHETAQRIVSLPAARRPDAVFCFNDMRACMLLEAARTAGLRVPEDMAITGFDGTPSAIDQGITTMELPFYPCGRNAAVSMYLLLNDHLRPPIHSSFAAGVRAGHTT